MTRPPGTSGAVVRDVLLQATGIVKAFGDFLANDHVSLAVAAGEIHALLGEMERVIGALDALGG